VPAAPSSSIDPLLGQVVALADVCVSRPGDLRAVLAQVTDPRARRGVRHRLDTVLVLAVCAVLAGARSFVAVAEWAADCDPATRAELGMVGSVPSESTFRRVLQRLDAEVFDAVCGAWAQQRTRPGVGRRRHLALDGKTLRGSGGAAGPPRHLLAALAHHHGVVLAQVDVGAKTGESPQVPILLDGLDLTDAVITADALHAQRATATYLHARGAHYVLTVKRNQPTLFAQLRSLPWKQVPVGDRRRDRAHGRVETRTVKVTAIRTGIGFPHATQAIQVVRRRRSRTGRWHTETAYAVTSLAAHQAGPADLGDAVRGHWKVENKLHWVRDVTFDEDRSQVRTGNGPRVMASLRNLAITALRLTGVTNIAAALRHHARRPNRPINTLMTC
jgi:predicted transposase YbfD/YdcC